MPTVILALFATLGLAAATVVASINAQHGTIRDQSSKAALAAAEAGVANALLRFNRIRTTSAANACAPVGGTNAAADGWCPQTVGPVAYDRGQYSYRVQVIPAAGTSPAQIEVTSTGAVDGATRRVNVRADTISEDFRPFSGGAEVIGLEAITLAANASIHAGVATNGNITMASNTQIVCDTAQVGPGKSVIPANASVSCPVTQGTTSLPPVNPGDVAANNSNSRICTLDPCENANWNPTTKRLSFAASGSGGRSVTLGAAGGVFNYAFCRITLRSNSYINVARGADVRLYLLAPEDCQGETNPLDLQADSKIEPVDEAAAGETKIALLIVGSATQWTTATLASNTETFCSQGFVLYAPRTTLNIASNNEICGGLAAQSITVASNVNVTATNPASDWELPGATMPPHYGGPHDFIECTAAAPGPGQAPDSGC